MYSYSGAVSLSPSPVAAAAGFCCRGPVSRSQSHSINSCAHALGAVKQQFEVLSWQDSKATERRDMPLIPKNLVHMFNL